MIKKFLMGLVIGITISACAHTPVPTTQIISVPTPVQPKQVSVPACPKLPIVDLTPEASWDNRLSAWNATVTILIGCLDARNNVILELNKP